MPGGDRTGPMGMGPRTGRAAGYCAGYDRPGYTNDFGRGGYGGGSGWGRGGGYGRGRGGGGWGRGRGYGWGRGGGYGYGNGMGPAVGQTPYPTWGAPPWGAAPTTEDELEMLKGEHENLKKILADIQKRIKDLQAKPEKN